MAVKASSTVMVDATVPSVLTQTVWRTPAPVLIAAVVVEVVMCVYVYPVRIVGTEFATVAGPVVRQPEFGMEQLIATFKFG